MIPKLGLYGTDLSCVAGPQLRKKAEMLETLRNRVFPYLAIPGVQDMTETDLRRYLCTCEDQKLRIVINNYLSLGEDLLLVHQELALRFRMQGNHRPLVMEVC